MLGANFDYRLMFLLLCLPQLLDWLARTSLDDEPTARILLVAVLMALWLNAYPFAIPTSMPKLGDPPILMPQLVNWGLLFGLTVIILLNFLNSAMRHEMTG
jgi:hypothetical protein